MTKKSLSMARVTGILLSLPVLIVGGLLLLYAAVGFLFLPYFLKQELPRVAATQLKSRAEIAEIRFNPFLFKLEVTGFSLTEDGADAPFVAFDRLFLDLEVKSLLRLAPDFNEISLDRPRLMLHIDKSGTLNVARVLARLPERPPRNDDRGLPPFVIGHAAITSGGIGFADDSTPEPMRADVQDFSLQLDDMSTLPNDRGAYTLSAKLKGGGSLGWRGGVTLQPLASDGEVALKDFRLDAVHPYLSRFLRIDDPAGIVEAGLRYAFAWRDGVLSFNATDMSAAVSGLQLKAAGAKDPRLTLDALRLSGGRLNLAEKKVSFAELALTRGNVSAVMDASGVTDWQKLVVAAPAAAQPAEPKADTAAVEKPVATRSARAGKGDGKKAASANAVPAKGNSAAPGAAGWQVGIDAVRIEDVAVRFQDDSRVQPFVADLGDVDIGFSLGMNTSDGSLLLDKLAVHLARVAVGPAGAGKPSITIDEAGTTGARVDLKAATANLPAVKLKGGAMTVMRAKDGAINLLQLFTSREPQPPSAFVTSVGTLDLSGYAVSYADDALGVPLAYEVGDIMLNVAGIQSDMKKPLRFEVAGTVKQGGTMKAGGTFDPGNNRTEVKLALSGFSLLPLEPLLSQYVTIKLVKGTASTDGRLVFDGQSKEPGLRYGGTVSIDDLQFNEGPNDRFLGWKSFAASGLYLNLGQSRLSVADMRLLEPFGKILIAKDRSVNLSSIAKQREAAPAAPASTASDAGPRFGATIDRVRIEKAQVEFADLSLVLPFATQVRDLSGVITGLSRDPQARAGVKLDGQVENYGLARVGGTINLFAPKVHTNLDVAFRNVEMTPLSPYTATFAGRKIESGRLSLDLQYRIQNSELQGENKVVLEKFKLGERVESPTALNLPLDLAIAVLTDSDDRINIAVPVRGNVDSPEFSYGHLVWQAIRTVLANIVTAPFRALGALFGGRTERAEDVVFDAGSAKLLPPEREKLDALAKTLAARPQLKLTVQGRYNEALDGADLREDAVRRELSNRAGIKVAPDEEAGPPLLDRARTQRVIEAMLEELGGADAVTRVAVQVEKERGKPVSRVNPALALVGRGSEDRGLYEAMYRRIVELWKLPPNALQDLASGRAQSIVAQLKTAGLDPSRVAAQAPVAMTGKEASAKLGLDAVR